MSKETEQLVRVRFIDNPYLDEYHSADVDFYFFGEEKEIPAPVAQRLLTVHSKLFELVDSEKRKVGRPPEKVEEVEKRFGKSLAEILFERRNMSVRAISKELNVGKSTVAKWRKVNCE